MSEVLEFETKQDFNNYYKEHQQELDELKTKELNNKFKVVGHKIIRNKGKITFRRIKETKNSSDSDNSELNINNEQKKDNKNDIINILNDIKTKLNNEFDNIIKSMNEQD